MPDEIDFSIDANSLSLDSSGNLIIKNVPQSLVDKIKARLKSEQREVEDRAATLRVVGTIT